jgi:hypothetical protein
MKQLIVVGKLPKGLSIGGVIYTGYEMREALLADMIDAELESGGAGNSIHYNAQLVVRQLTKVSSADGQEFKGPFVVGMIKKRGDFLALRKSQLELDDLGNAEPNASDSTGMPSN